MIFVPVNGMEETRKACRIFVEKYIVNARENGKGLEK
jgi:ribosome-associated protein YbcJ (S4-like RNA binding protein)